MEKYFNFNVTFKISKDENFSEVITLTPTGDGQIKLYLGDDEEYMFQFPDTEDLPNIKKFNRLLYYDFVGDYESANPPYLSLDYNSMLVSNYVYSGYDFCFYDGGTIAGKIEVYNGTGTIKYPAKNVFEKEGEENESNKIWLNKDLWNDNADIERFNKNYSFVVYFIDQKNSLFDEKDVRIPSIYRPFYMQNYIILSSKINRYMFNINNAIGLKNEDGRYYIGDLETSIQVNDVYKKDFDYKNLYSNDISSLLFKNYNYNYNTYGFFNSTTGSTETITLKYKIQFKEKEPTFSHPDFLINSVYEENNLSFYGISYSVKPKEIKNEDKDVEMCAQIYINKVEGTSSSGIRYFVTNMKFTEFVNNVYNIKVPSEKYDLYPSKIRKDTSWYTYYCGVYSFDYIFKTAPGDTSIDSQNSSNRYAYELKNLYEYSERSSDGYYILTYKAPKGTPKDDINKENFHIVAIYDPVTLLSDDDMIQEQLYSKILKPHNNFTSIMRIY